MKKLIFLILALLLSIETLAAAQIPVADAGLPRYTDTEPVVLDGTGSYDPDGSGELQYNWQQISGPALEITGSNTATPTISGFVQTDSVQICQFELTVSDGQNESEPDIAIVWIVPSSNVITMILENESPFDADKPSVIYFSGGDCITGAGGWDSVLWYDRANVFSFTIYQPDDNSAERTYYKCGDVIILYLSRMAPHYNQPIQIMGHSTGGQPAIDSALRLNQVYQDTRYAANRVTFLDARCRDYSASTAEYLTSSVDGEQCWIDTYEGSGPNFYYGILNVQVTTNEHLFPPAWYGNSLTNPDMNQFNGGVIGGAYWSVVGPGKNLQLAYTPDRITYGFNWEGTRYEGQMEFFDEANLPAKLPEPVTLASPIDVEDSDGVILTCQESENAVGYQLLLGSNPDRVMDYEIISDTPNPPTEIITTLPFEETWWTVKARDQYGSTIFADPRPISAFNLTSPVQNLTTEKRYSYIQDAIDEASSGDEIILNQGTYNEQIDLRGKNLIIRSTNPDDSAVVAATIIKGRESGAAVTFSSGEDASCLLTGLTIAGRKTGIYCSGANPTISKCNITGNSSAGIKLWGESNVTITNCVIANNGAAGIEMWAEKVGRVIKDNFATITNCTITNNAQQGVWGSKPTIKNSIIYFNGGNQIETDFAIVNYSDVQGGRAGEGNIDADPLFADVSNDDYHLKSQTSRRELVSQSWVQDDVTSPCIDAGDPASDRTAEPEPNGQRINMGAYGGTSQASMSL